jgi:hypothetical protein
MGVLFLLKRMPRVICGMAASSALEALVDPT